MVVLLECIAGGCNRGLAMGLALLASAEISALSVCLWHHKRGNRVCLYVLIVPVTSVIIPDGCRVCCDMRALHLVCADEWWGLPSERLLTLSVVFWTRIWSRKELFQGCTEHWLAAPSARSPRAKWESQRPPYCCAPGAGFRMCAPAGVSRKPCRD